MLLLWEVIPHLTTLVCAYISAQTLPHHMFVKCTYFFDNMGTEMGPRGSEGRVWVGWKAAQLCEIIFPFIPPLSCHSDTSCLRCLSCIRVDQAGETMFLYSPTPVWKKKHWFLGYTMFKKPGYYRKRTVNRLWECLEKNQLNDDGLKQLERWILCLQWSDSVWLVTLSRLRQVLLLSDVAPTH